MRLANDDFANNVGGFNGIGANMSNYDQPGRFTAGVNEGMMYCLSHDNNHMAGSERATAHDCARLYPHIPVPPGLALSGWMLAGR